MCSLYSVLNFLLHSSQILSSICFLRKLQRKKTATKLIAAEKNLLNYHVVFVVQLNPNGSLWSLSSMCSHFICKMQKSMNEFMPKLCRVCFARSLVSAPHTKCCSTHSLDAAAIKPQCTLHCTSLEKKPSSKMPKSILPT